MLLPRGNSSMTPRPYLSPPFRLPLCLTDLYNRIQCAVATNVVVMYKRTRLLSSPIRLLLLLLLLFRTANGFCLCCRRRVLWTPNIDDICILVFFFRSLFARFYVAVPSNYCGLINVLRFVVVEFILKKKKNTDKCKKKTVYYYTHSVLSL